jgi:hypothetical protein
VSALLSFLRRELQVEDGGIRRTGAARADKRLHGRGPLDLVIVAPDDIFLAADVRRREQREKIGQE